MTPAGFELAFSVGELPQTLDRAATETGLYRIKWLIFMTGTACVYCTVRSEYLNVIQAKYFLYSFKIWF